MVRSRTPPKGRGLKIPPVVSRLWINGTFDTRKLKIKELFSTSGRKAIGQERDRGTLFRLQGQNKSFGSPPRHLHFWGGQGLPLFNAPLSKLSCCLPGCIKATFHSVFFFPRVRTSVVTMALPSLKASRVFRRLHQTSTPL